jgi:hypothetical protein
MYAVDSGHCKAVDAHYLIAKRFRYARVQVQVHVAMLERQEAHVGATCALKAHAGDCDNLSWSGRKLGRARECA